MLHSLEHLKTELKVLSNELMRFTQASLCILRGEFPHPELSQLCASVLRADSESVPHVAQLRKSQTAGEGRRERSHSRTGEGRGCSGAGFIKFYFWEKEVFFN